MPPESLPVLAKGKHRNVRRGACFMEFASLLAGERWSDHPRCTHPVLAALARAVNDVTSDDARPMLAPLIPDVIGTSEDVPRVAPELAVLTCRTALGQVAEARPRFVLTVALVSAERMLVAAGVAVEGEDGMTAQERATAESYVDRFRLSPRFYRRKGAEGVVETAVASMAAHRGPGTDAVLRDLLTRAVARYWEVVPARAAERPALDAGSWSAAVATVGRARAR